MNAEARVALQNHARSGFAWMLAAATLLYGCLRAGTPLAGRVGGLQTASLRGDAGQSGEDADSLAEMDLDVFDGRLAAGWVDWSWASRQMGERNMLFHDQPTLRFEPSDWKGVFLHTEGFQSKAYSALSFGIRGAGSGGQHVAVCLVDGGGKFLSKFDIATFLADHRIPQDSFAQCVIPLERLIPDGGTCTGVCLQDSSGAEQSPVYVGDLKLTAVPEPSAIDIRLDVDTGKRIGPISPYIYGIAQPKPEQVRKLKLKLTRWGGNPSTRYNWAKGNCWNAARDWQFRNLNYGSNKPEQRLPGACADESIDNNRRDGSDLILTIPTMGWVARDDNQDHQSTGVPDHGGPPISQGSDAIAGYDPAANRARMSQRSMPRKPGPLQDPPDPSEDTVYQDEWVYHLVRKYGKASAGGVRFYAMDNEPDLWDNTHTDMHPVSPGYDEIVDRFLDYANAVKDVDPSATILGPVSWGWTGFFYSALDRGKDNFHTHADRNAHGGMPFIPYFLQEAARRDSTKGRRSLDVLDVHFYPQAQGIYAGATDPGTQALRLRSTRCLWDTNYLDESWIGTQVALIPRLHDWVKMFYPGTKLALTEWNWGAERTVNGALTIAEVLGIFGREQLDMACYWTAPPVGSPGEQAFAIYRNADGAGKGFGDVAVKADSSAPGRVSCFGAVDSTTGEATIMVINKRLRQTGQVTLNLAGTAATSANIYQYSDAAPDSITHLPSRSITGGRLNLSVPAASITLIRCR